ncbi:MAG TPA: hypothetical protein VGD76_16855 [Ramlibacter sp.]
MDKDTAYRKTTSGVDAIAARNPALTQRQRSLLILVDGRRSAKELATLASGFGDVEELLQPLLEHGFIEPIGQRKAAHGAGTGGPADPKAGTPYAQVRSLAVRRLNDLLGPGAADLCIRLESARNVDEFRAALRRVEGILRQVLGGQRAEQFITEVENLRAS